MGAKILGLLFIVVLLAGCWQSGWKGLVSKKGEFTILMHGSPHKEVFTTFTPDGQIDKYKFVLVKESVTYTVRFVDYPEIVVEKSTKDSLLDEAQKRAVSNLQGKLMAGKSISLNGYPGREVEIEFAGGETIYQCRMYLVGARFYQVSVEMPKEKASQKSVEKFLNSFKLNKQ